MLTKFNTFVRLLLVIFLVVPMYAEAQEVQVNEGFEDTTFESGFTITATSDPVQVYSAEIDQYGTTGASLGVCHMNNNCTAEYTFEFSTDIKVYEVGFVVGAVNDPYSIIWHYSDGTTETENKAAQSNSNLSTMYDDIYKTFTDYNAVEENTDKFITKFVLDIHDWSLLDTLYFQYDDEVATGSFAPATTTPPPSLGPPMNPVVTQEYNVGVKVDWDEADTGNQTADSYELYYRTSADNEIKIENITETEYTIPYADIPNGTWTFSIRGYNSSNTLFSGYSTEPTLEVFNQKAQDDADEAARKEAERKAEEERQAELQRQRDKNLSETGYSETDDERADREYKEEQERLAELERQRVANESETGYYETDEERADREYKEEQERLAELERQRNANEAETGYFETDEEREIREAEELAAEQARIEEEIKNTVVIKTDGEELTEEEQQEIDELVDAIIEIQENTDFEEYEVEEEIIEFEEIPEEIIIVLPEEEIKDETPIKEVFDEDESIPVEDDITEDVVTILDTTDREGEEVELTEEQVEEIIEVIEEAEVEEVVEILEEVVVEEVTEEQVEIVQAVVDKVVEEVEDLTVEEQEVVAEVLGFTEVEDVEIVAEAIESDEVVAEAVAIFVEKAVENKDIEDYTLADVVVEVKVDEFLDNPIGAIVEIDLTDFNVSELGQDMTNDQREKSKEVVVPVIIASQIIASASVIPVRELDEKMV